MMVMTRHMLRRPAGIPEGGQFSGRVFASAQVSLDPWAIEAPQGQHGHLSVVHEVAACLGDEQGEARLVQEYGSVEKAVIHAGSLVAERAEEIAGISADDIAVDHKKFIARSKQRVDESESARQRAREAYDDEMVPLRERHLAGEITRAEFDEAEAKVRKRHNLDDLDDLVTDARTLAAEAKAPTVCNDMPANHRKLSDGYLQALSEVREMGGEMDFHPTSTRPGLKAFNEATAVFPADWIQASNDAATKPTEHRLRNGRTMEFPPAAPKVRIDRHGVHYKAISRVGPAPLRHAKLLATPQAPAAEEMRKYGRSADPRVEYVPTGDPSRPWEGMSYQSTRPRAGGLSLPPEGQGWEKWVDPVDSTQVAWRRPSMQRAHLEADHAPEITSSKGEFQDPGQVEGRSATFANSVHELSHRFEGTVDQVKRLEQDFLARRTTDPSTGRRFPRRPMYPGSRSVLVRDGGFVSKYTTREYENGETEVLSTGMEFMFGGRRGGLVGWSGDHADTEHRDFVLGVLATVGRRGI